MLLCIFRIFAPILLLGRLDTSGLPGIAWDYLGLPRTYDHRAGA